MVYRYSVCCVPSTDGPRCCVDGSAACNQKTHLTAHIHVHEVDGTPNCCRYDLPYRIHTESIRARRRAGLPVPSVAIDGVDRFSPLTPTNTSHSPSDHPTHRLHTLLPIEARKRLSRLRCAHIAGGLPPRVAFSAPANFLLTNSASARPERHKH